MSSSVWRLNIPWDDLISKIAKESVFTSKEDAQKAFDILADYYCMPPIMRKIGGIYEVASDAYLSTIEKLYIKDNRRATVIINPWSRTINVYIQKPSTHDSPIRIKNGRTGPYQGRCATIFNVPFKGDISKLIDDAADFAVHNRGRALVEGYKEFEVIVYDLLEKE